MTLAIRATMRTAFLPDYLKKEILERDPFQSIDTGGVGQLMSMAVHKGRSTRRG